MEKCIYLGQTISVNPAQRKKNRWRIRMDWSAFGKRGDIMNNNPSLFFEEKGGEHVCPSSINIRFRDLAPH